MGGYHTLYGGAGYGVNPDYGEQFDNSTDYIPVGELGMATDARTANQIKAASEKIRAGIKTIEIQMTSPDVAKAIPQQHLEELNRLRKLAGVDLTLHGPLIEPTGVTQQGWDEGQRMHAQREMEQAVERGHALDPDGNIVVTFHTSAGLLAPKQTEKIKGKDVVTNIAVVDERTGQMGYLPKEGEEHFIKEKETDPYKRLKHLNERRWTGEVNELSLATNRGEQEVKQALMSEKPISAKDQEESMKLFSLSLKNPKKYRADMAKLSEVSPEMGAWTERFVSEMNYGNIFIRNAYEKFKGLYNEAYEAAKISKDKKMIEKLEEFRNEIAPKVEKYEDDPTKILALKDELKKGIALLGEVKPELYRPLENFAKDKASETFSNVALKAYEDFGKKAPIIALENPPVGMGISRGEEIKELVEESQRKLAQKLQEKKGMTKSESEKEAQKLIGVTWDVGHINMLRKYGYKNEDLRRETAHIAKHVKKVHLSDNFGFEHSELPMGMGNVPMKEHLAELKKAHKEQLKNIKKVIEAGDWYQHFQTTPFSLFGNPIYSMKAAPYWKAQPTGGGSYFAGYGLNPDFHHQMYGAGFAMLPTELGGQMSGRSRTSGSPIE